MFTSRRPPTRRLGSFGQRNPISVRLLAIAGVFLLEILIALSSYSVSFIALGVLTGAIPVAWYVLTILTKTSVSSPSADVPPVLGATILAFFIGWGITFGIVKMNRNGYLRSTGLEDRIDNFADAGRVTRQGKPELVGKVVVLEKEGSSKYRFRRMQFEIDKKLRPKSHREVGTVILVHWNKEKIADYGRPTTTEGAPPVAYGGGAYQWQVNVFLVDYRNHAIYHRNRVIGSMPPERVKDYEDHEGDKPYEEILDWINDLPHREG